MCITGGLDWQQAADPLFEESESRLGRAQVNAVRLNVKDFLPQKFKGKRSQFKPWADEDMLHLQTIRQPITDQNVISGYNLEADAMIHSYRMKRGGS
eukprot:6193767-Amphidinium_carterae.2